MRGGAERPFQRRRLRYDHVFRLEADYSVDKGIPWKRYLREFAAEDRALVQAVLLERSLRCANCGTAPWEWEDEHGAPNPGAFRAVTHVCLGDAAIERLRKSQENTAGVPGSNIKLVPETVFEHRERKGFSRPLSARERSRQ